MWDEVHVCETHNLYTIINWFISRYFRLLIIMLLVPVKGNACMVMIYFSFSLKDYLEKNDSTSESVVWEFLVDLSLVSIVQIDEML